MKKLTHFYTEKMAVLPVITVVIILLLTVIPVSTVNACDNTDNTGNDTTDNGNSTSSSESFAVSLSANIISSLSIEVTPGAICFGSLAPGETSDTQKIYIRNKGAKDIEVTAETFDVARDLYVDGLRLDSENWEVFSADVSRNNCKTVNASLEVPSDFTGVGSMEGKVVFWAEM